MKDEILDDHLTTGHAQQALAKERKRLWYTIVVAGLMDTVIISLFAGKDVFLNHFLNNLFFVAAAILLFGLGLGLLVAAIPYKNLSYSDKYLRSSQWSMVFASSCLLLISVYFIWNLAALT